MYPSAESFVEDFLKRVRALVDYEKLSIDRLPKWVKCANVRIGKLNNSNIFLFEDSPVDKDEIVSYGEFCSDLQFFLELPEYLVTGASFRAPAKGNIGLTVLYGEYDKDGKVIFNITSPSSALFNAGYIPYHIPMSLVNILIQLSPVGAVLAARFIPLAIYIHDRDLADFEDLWNRASRSMQDILMSLHNSPAGDYYQQTAERKKAFLVGKEKSVIVFGKYGDPEMRELVQVRDYLSKRYDAYLLKDLPEHPAMSLEEKVKAWASASRFCVMIDREPSGHLVEYPYLKSTRAILILLRSEAGGSTTMIEDNSMDFPFIRTFRFKNSPLEVTDNAVIWAEGHIKERIKAK